MLTDIREIFIYTFILALFFGCEAPKNEKIPADILHIENLTSYSKSADVRKTITLEKDVVYGKSDDIIIGMYGEVAVDSLGRVFISNSFKKIIYIYDTEGELVGRLGGEGRGPGEFSKWIRNLQIRNHRLYALDASMHRLNVFSLEDLSIEETVSLAGNRNRYPELARTFPAIRNLFVRTDESFIAEFVNHASQERTQRFENVDMQSHYYLLNSSGAIEAKLVDFISATLTDLGIVYNLREFFGHTLNAFSNDDFIYLAGPDEFLIKAFRSDGDYHEAFYYPVRRIPLTRETADNAGISFIRSLAGTEVDLMEKVELPENWPVMTDFLIDDQDRFWIAATVEDMSVYEWWILEENGELITKFEWPRNKPIEVINNGYMYTRETDEETGLQQVVRYEIRGG